MPVHLQIKVISGVRFELLHTNLFSCLPFAFLNQNMDWKKFQLFFSISPPSSFNLHHHHHNHHHHPQHHHHRHHNHRHHHHHTLISSIMTPTQVVAVVSCMFVVVSTLCLIFSTLPRFQQKDANGIIRKSCHHCFFIYLFIIIIIFLSSSFQRCPAFPSYHPTRLHQKRFTMTTSVSTQPSSTF